MGSLTLDFIERLPKTDLHCHLDGSIRVTTILDLAQKQKVKLPAEDPDKLFKLIYAGERCRSLDDYLKAFDITLSVLQTEEALFRAAYELAEDCARENVRYLEVRYSPMLHTQRGLKLAPIVESVIQGLRAGERDFGVRSGVILCGIRSIDPAMSLRMAELCVAFKNRGVVAFDLAGAEYNYPAKAHRAAFQLVIRNNVNSTVHGGEAFGPESIAQALHYCGAHRIGHGTRLIEDADLMAFVNDHRIPLEVCLTSNLQTRVVRRIQEHPFRHYFKSGLRVTLNTDNRLMSATTVSQELDLACRAFRLSPYELKRIIINGFKSSFLPYAQKARMLREVNLDIDRVFMEEFPEEYDRRASY